MTTRVFWPILGLLAAVAITTTPSWVGIYYLGIITSALFFVGLASAWNIVGGMAGQFSLGNSLFVAMGSTVVAALISLHGWNVWLAMLAGAVGSAVLALAISILMFRRQLPHLSFAIVTLAFAEIGLLLVISTPAVGAASGVVWSEGGFGTNSQAGYLMMALVSAVVLVVLSWIIRRSRLGHRMRAIRDDESAAAAIGTNLLWTKTAALVISAVLTSLVATLYANYLVFVDPQSFASPVLSITVILFAVVGGLGTVKGPVLGAAILYPIGELLRGEFGNLPGLSNAVFGAAIILIVLFAPTGISGLISRVPGLFRWQSRGDPAVMSPLAPRSGSDREGGVSVNKRVPAHAEVSPSPHLPETEKS